MYSFRNSSLTKEQLNNLGVTSKDSNVTQFTRPLFPVLASKPSEIEKSVGLDYKMVWKEDFRSRLFEMHSNPTDQNSDSYSFKIASALEKEHKQKLQLKFAYSQMPAELNIQNLKKRTKNTKPVIPNKKRKILKMEDVTKELEILEKKEKLHDDDEGSEKAAEGSDEEGEIEGDVEDPELDDETDYHNNYFDNGENYFADEDDALDDGPVY
ncbi:DNA-directed RNA polymerase III subunit RPC7-like [Chironomus tepperi]|uniref:DNA-directed RNA polymerase III subunit RPC7-like n=1 Tax=Chironomus tepperi TaxID=113505 RepID=UPI00391FA4F5